MAPVAPHPEPNPNGDQRRGIGLGAAVALTVGNIVGAGIFLTPSAVAAETPSIGLYLALWLVGGLVALAGALATAELGSMFPRAGGDYVFLGEAFGRPVAFAWGAVAFGATFAGSIAALAAGTTGTILSMTWAGGAAKQTWEVVGVTLSLGQIAAAGLIWLVTLVHALGLRAVGRVQSAVTWIPIAIFTVAGLWAVAAGADSGLTSVERPSRDIELTGLAGAFCAVFFSYSGWNVLTFMGGEVKTPGRTLPRAILVALGVTVGVYLLLNAAFLRTQPLEALAGATNAGVVTAESLFGSVGADTFAVVLAGAIVAGLSATIMAGSRIGWAMARDGYLWRGLAATRGHSGLPLRALLLQAAWSTILVLSGEFMTLVTFTGAAMLLLGCLTVSSLFVHRRRGRSAEYRTPGYPWTPLFFVVVGLAVVSFVAVREWDHLLIGLGIFGVLGAAELALRRFRRS